MALDDDIQLLDRDDAAVAAGELAGLEHGQLGRILRPLDFGFDAADRAGEAAAPDMGRLLLQGEGRRRPRRWYEALSAEEHHGDQDDAEDELDGLDEIDALQPGAAQRAAQHVAPAREVLEEPGLQQLEDDGGQDHAIDAAHAAQHDHDQEHDRNREHEHVRGRRLQLGDIEGAGHAAEGGADREGQQLQMGPVDAHGAGGDLILADRHPGAPHPRILQPQADEDQHPDHQQAEIVVGARGDAEGIAEEARRGRAVEADGAVRQIGRVARDDGHDLAEAQGDDGEIIAAQPQGGRPE